MAIATRVAEQAAAGRAARGLRRAIRRHGGAGLRRRDRAAPVGPDRGHRHPGDPDGRVGFAYGGVLDEASVAEVLAEARDNVSFGTPDEWAGLASPDGVAPPDARPLARRPRDVRHRRQGRAGPRARAAHAGRGPAGAGRGGRVRRRHGRGGRRHLDRRAARPDGRAAATSWCPRSPPRATRPRPASPSRVGRTPGELDIEKASREGAERATRLLGATKPASKRTDGGVRPVRHRPVPVGAVGGAERGVGAEGSVAVRQPRRRGGGVAAVHPGRRPDQPAGLLGHPGRRRGSRHPAHVADRGRRPPGLPAELLQRPAQRARPPPATPCGAFKSTPACGAIALPAGARHPVAGRAASPASTTACSSSRSPASTPA